MKKGRANSNLKQALLIVVDFLEITGKGENKDRCPALVWMEGLEKMAQVSVTRYIRRVADSVLQSEGGRVPITLNYVKPLKGGGGVHEITVGKSIYRVYFALNMGRMVLILGGDKGGQKHPDKSGDAEKAIKYWGMFRNDEGARVVRRLRDGKATQGQ